MRYADYNGFRVWFHFVDGKWHIDNPARYDNHYGNRAYCGKYLPEDSSVSDDIPKSRACRGCLRGFGAKETPV